MLTREIGRARAWRRQHRAARPPAARGPVGSPRRPPIAPGGRHAERPGAGGGGLRATVILGELDGAASPGTTFTPLMGADIALAAGTDARLPVRSDFEYAALTMSGEAEVDGVRLAPGSLLYLGCGRTELPLRADVDSAFMLLGGEPFEEKIVMWWNFIGRSHDEIAQAREDWAAGTRFGTVHGYDGNPLPAPELPPVPLKARGRTR
ncbi:Pirin OS=Streptomyces antimycoticus OX=68175 GN=SSPO_084870 PE=3 SV=1 [Streptomyces antimycoticus]